jgi:lysophospholipase L1-like esterase
MIKSRKKILTVLLFLFSANLIVSGQASLDFEKGLAGWITSDSNNVHIDHTNSHKGKNCVRIGESSASIFRRLPVKQFSIVQFDCYVKSDGSTKGYSFIRFYDAKQKKLLEYKSNAVDSATYQQTGNYTEAPALASYMDIGVEKDSVNGSIYVDDFSIESNIGVPKKKHVPAIDLDKYMRPSWHSDTIYNETVLLYSVNGNPAEGRLLYTPDQILSVKSFDLRNSYKEAKDYSLNGNTISRTQTSQMPFRADTSFDSKNDLAWFKLQSQWIVISYTHHDNWNGPVPVYKGPQLPNTMSKLRSKATLKIAAFGMSITRGMNVSSYDEVSPYMPTYVDLFARELRKIYRDSNITLYNTGLPGATVDWGANYADKYIDPLKPDLVIIDFGMNDFWRLTPDQFEEYIKTIMQKIKAGNPKVEFILLSNMKFDPDYILDSDKNKNFYQSNLEGYSRVLKKMEAKGVINLDMYTISDYVYKLKRAKDCIANPLHPNDYLARWYAQGLATLLIEPRFTRLQKD